MARTDVRVSAIIIKNNKILLIHRKKNNEEYWVFPGGAVEDFETVEEGLVREVKEEANLSVEKFNLEFMCYNEASKSDQPFYSCVVSDGTPEIIGEEKDKNSSENWYKLEWVNMKRIKDIWLVPDKVKEEIIKRYIKLD